MKKNTIAYTIIFFLICTAVIVIIKNYSSNSFFQRDLFLLLLGMGTPHRTSGDGFIRVGTGFLSSEGKAKGSLITRRDEGGKRK